MTKINRNYSKLQTKSEMKILLTGFEPYSGYKENPSEKIVDAFRNHKHRQGSYLFVEVLPVSFERTRKEIKTLIKTLRPDLLIMLGFSPKSISFEVEKIAVNSNGPSSPKNISLLDNDRRYAYGKISKKGSHTYNTTLPIPILFRTFKAFDLPVKRSYKAGTFVCNLALYAALEEVNCLDLPTRVAFIHVPPLDNIGLGKAIEVMRYILCAFESSKWVGGTE